MANEKKTTSRSSSASRNGAGAKEAKAKERPYRRR